jgi:hypothetical protein
MLLMMYVEMDCIKRGMSYERACIAWTSDGAAFRICNQDELVNRIFPAVFHQKGKFSSFTRKLYRWGFRQILTKANKDVQNKTEAVKVFCHKYFQRVDKTLLAKMRSVTTEGIKKIVRSNVSRQPSPSQNHTVWNLADVGSTGLSGITIPSDLHRSQGTMRSLSAGQSIQELLQHARSLAGTTLPMLSNPVLFPGSSVLHPSLSAASFYPTAPRHSALINAYQPLRQLGWTPSMEMSLHPLVHTALAIRHQRQQAHDIAQARLHLAALAQHQNFQIGIPSLDCRQSSEADDSSSKEEE